MKWICSVCGHVHEGDQAPAECPVCKAPAEKFTQQVEGEMSWAAEHVLGVAQGAPQDIIDGLDGSTEHDARSTTSHTTRR